MNGNLLEFRSVRQSFGGVQALKGVSFDIRKGQITGIIGPNGAGKTTIFNVITGAYKPDAGEIRFNGRNISGMAPYMIARSGIARTFQNIRLFASMTVWEHLLVAQPQASSNLRRLLPTRLNDAATRENAEQALEFFGLQAARGRIAKSLPYGLQRKVEMARALTAKPDLLLLDEPVAGMNHDEAENLRSLLVKLREGGLTILLIEHDMTFVMNLCDWLRVLDFGEMIAHGTPSEIRRDPVVLDAYLGGDE